MGILNCWRQFGRRYFWLHPMLMMVAARFGMLLLPGGAQEMLHQADSCASFSWQSTFQTGLSQLARFKDVLRHPAYSVDYWHQYAIRTVIRYLSIDWVLVPAPEVIASLREQHHTLLTTLGLLLNHEVRQSMLVHRLRQTSHVAFIDYHTGIRLAQLQGN